MQSSVASWRLREQQRKQGAADEARRRAVEVSEISFPSLAGAGSAASSSSWGVAPLAHSVSAAAERWTSGAASAASYVTPSSSNTAPTSTTKRFSGVGAGAGAGAGAGIHSRISATVRQTTHFRQSQHCDDDYYESTIINYDYDDDDGWTEVSKAKKTTRAIVTTRNEDYAFDDNGSFGDEEENM